MATPTGIRLGDPKNKKSVRARVDKQVKRLRKLGIDINTHAYVVNATTAQLIKDEGAE